MTRLITGLCLAVFGCYIVFLSPPLAFRVAALVVSIVCYREFSQLVTHHGIRPTFTFGLLAGLVFIVEPDYAVIGLSLATIGGMAWALRTDTLRDILPQVAAECLGAVYAFLPWHFAEVLRGFSVHWLFFALASNWFGDSLAYYVGRSFGKHRLAPVVSPNKSWEGAAGSVAGSIIFGLVYMGHFLPNIAWWKIAAIAIVANVAGQLGDLAESAMKRGAGVKDSGHFLPGHGGLLDRLDSSMFSLPVVYALSQFL
jgi:phosphatidate cytidylyltransferase